MHVKITTLEGDTYVVPTEGLGLSHWCAPEERAEGFRAWMFGRNVGSIDADMYASIQKALPPAGAFKPKPQTSTTVVSSYEPPSVLNEGTQKKGGVNNPPMTPRPPPPKGQGGKG